MHRSIRIEIYYIYLVINVLHRHQVAIYDVNVSQACGVTVTPSAIPFPLQSVPSLTLVLPLSSIDIGMDSAKRLRDAN